MMINGPQRSNEKMPSNTGHYGPDKKAYSMTIYLLGFLKSHIHQEELVSVENRSLPFSQEGKQWKTV